MSLYHELDRRMTAVEAKQRKVDDMVDLLEDVRSALKVLIVIGNGFKWLVGIGFAIGAAYYAVKRWIG